MTVFSIFDTGTGTVSSYRFDMCKTDGEVIKFDEFRLNFYHNIACDSSGG